MLFLYRSKFVTNPQQARELEDEPDTWSTLLDDPEAIPEDDEDAKEGASVLCGARYFMGVEDCRDREGIDGVECIVLDVDVEPVPDEATLRNALRGVRAVVYASPSHTRANPRWRVLLPLRTPLPPKRHRSLVERLSAGLVPGYEGCVNASATGDPGRLGFVGVTKHPEDYTWFSLPGERFDWTALPLYEEEWVEGPLSGMNRSDRWTDRAQGLRDALKFYAAMGQGLRQGGGRSVVVWKVANALWWEWAAEDEDFVLAVLEQVNANFATPEEVEELHRQSYEAHKRTIGERRKSQTNGAYGWRREPSGTVSVASLLSHAKRLKNRRSPDSVELGEAIVRAVKRGQTVADDPQVWPGLMTKLAHELAKAYPNEDASRIAEFFRAALLAMRTKSALGPLPEEFAAWVDQRLVFVKKQREERFARQDALVKDQIEFITRGERDTKYTQGEVEHWENVGLRQDTWVLVNKGGYYVFVNGTWVGPYTEKEFDAQGYKDLAAAADVGVRTQKFSEKAQEFVNVPLKVLLQHYGGQCQVRMDLNCERAWFNVDDRTLVLAGPPKRKLEARFHEDVDEWFRVMTGRERGVSAKLRQSEAATVGLKNDDYDALCDWCACVTALDHPCAALYLQGSPSVGKGLFADGISRLWKTGAIGLEDAFANFNSLLMETPLIWVDEQLPEHVRASVLLRKALAAREFVFKRKYADEGKVNGCLRILFTANNLELFNKSKELLRKADVDALKVRFVHVKVRDASAKFLEDIAPRHEAFVEKNMLAEHALWLQEKRWAAIRKRGHRFLVKGGNTNVSDVVATNNDVTSECCSAICKALLNENAARSASWLLVRDGEVLVNANALKEELTILNNQVISRATERDVVRSVESISGRSVVVRNERANKPMRMRPIGQITLQAWCENSSVYEWEDVSAAVEKLDRETRKRAEAAVTGGPGSKVIN